MFVVRGKSGKVLGSYKTRGEAARRIAQLAENAARLAPYKFGGGHRRSQRSPRPFKEITRADVGKSLFSAFGRKWRTDEFIGRIMAQDVGKRVYLVAPDMVQVENDAQRAKRGEHSWRGQPRRHAKAAQLGHRRSRRARSPSDPYRERVKRNQVKMKELRRFSRSELIAALGLEAEGSKRQQKYNFTTTEFRKRIATGLSQRDIEARQRLGLT